MRFEIWKRILIYLVLIAVGFLGGWAAKSNFRTPINRFEAIEGTVLDTQTGQICRPRSDSEQSDIPTCVDLYKKY